MNRWILASLIVTAVASFQAVIGARSAPFSGSTDGGEIVALVHGGLIRTALVYVPPGYNRDTATPLVLSFHGRYGRGKDQAALTGLHEVGARYGFLVAYPDGVLGSWNAGTGAGDAEARGIDDVGFVDALVAKLSQRYNVDPNRIYATGMSNGASFAQRLGCERSSLFAGIGAVAGEMAPAVANACRPADALAVLTIHGTMDPVAPYDGGTTEAGGVSLSAQETAATWSRLNVCVAGEMSEMFRKGQVVGRSYQNCRAPVTLFTVEDGGHTWPGGSEYASQLLVGETNRDISASETLWQFFQANPKRRAVPAPSGLRIQAIR